MHSCFDSLIGILMVEGAASTLYPKLLQFWDTTGAVLSAVLKGFGYVHRRRYSFHLLSKVHPKLVLCDAIQGVLGLQKACSAICVSVCVYALCTGP